MPRHQALNDIIQHSLIKAGVPAVKEPSGLSRADGRQPDGMTLTPWCSGKSLVWDVTVINTMAESYMNVSSQRAAGVAELAAERKTVKYSFLPVNFVFQPIAVETMGPLNQTGLDFVCELSRRMQETSGDPRERDFLFQRISVTIQRYNAAAFAGCFVDSADSNY
jgi:hypothetical protein